MAICSDCKQVMHKAASCTKPFIFIGGTKYRRDVTCYDVNKHCHDCGIENKPGNVHHSGCDIERCPKCGGQLTSCGCDVQDVTDDPEGAKKKLYVSMCLHSGNVTILVGRQPYTSKEWLPDGCTGILFVFDTLAALRKTFKKEAEYQICEAVPPVDSKTTL